MTKKQIGSEPIYDARALGTPRMLVLGLQHMFAMFGATVLVPALTIHCKWRNEIFPVFRFEDTPG